MTGYKRYISIVLPACSLFRHNLVLKSLAMHTMVGVFRKLRFSVCVSFKVKFRLFSISAIWRKQYVICGYGYHMRMSYYSEYVDHDRDDSINHFERHWGSPTSTSSSAGGQKPAPLFHSGPIPHVKSKPNVHLQVSSHLSPIWKQRQ